jgi:predicted RNA binding protein YcfA (HicA-like mRNA interferase family)
MKRRDVVRRLIENGVQSLRESKHEIFWSPITNKAVSVKHHREIPDHEAREIFKQAGVRWPK